MWLSFINQESSQGHPKVEGGTLMWGWQKQVTVRQPGRKVLVAPHLQPETAWKIHITRQWNSLLLAMLKREDFLVSLHRPQEGSCCLLLFLKVFSVHLNLHRQVTHQEIFFTHLRDPKDSQESKELFIPSPSSCIYKTEKWNTAHGGHITVCHQSGWLLSLV